MGCHTWFYRKIERSQEEAKSNCLKGLRHSRNLAWKIYRRPTSYYGINWVGEFNAKVDLYKNKQLNYKTIRRLMVVFIKRRGRAVCKIINIRLIL